MSEDDLAVCFYNRFPVNSVAIERRDQSFEKAEQQVKRWCNLFQISEPVRNRDFEDWHESAAMFLAAIDSGLPVIVAHPENGLPVADHLFNGAIVEMLDTAKLIQAGVGYRQQPGQLIQHWTWPPTETMWAGTFYFDNPAFIKHAGRGIALTGGHPEQKSTYTFPDEEDIESLNPMAMTIQKMARQYGDELIIKNITTIKYAPVEPFKVRNIEDLEDIKKQLIEVFGYDLIYIDGHIPRFMVQEKIDMMHEYRIAVINGEPVAGAGCIEKFCPPYNSGEIFHPLTEKIRGNSIIENSEKIVQKYVEAAKIVVNDFMKNDISSRDIILDFAITNKNKVVLIEANPIFGFGLYAMNYKNVFDKIVQKLKYDLKTNNEYSIN